MGKKKKFQSVKQTATLPSPSDSEISSMVFALDPEINDICRKVYSAGRDDNYEKALKLIKEYIFTNQDSFDLYSFEAYFHCVGSRKVQKGTKHQLMHFNSVIKSAELALAILPNSLELCLVVANYLFKLAHMNNNNWDRVIAACKRALEIDNPDTTLLRGSPANLIVENYCKETKINLETTPEKITDMKKRINDILVFSQVSKERKDYEGIDVGTAMKAKGKEKEEGTMLGTEQPQDIPKDAVEKIGASEAPKAPMVIPLSPSPATKGRKGENSQISGTSSTDSTNEQACSSAAPSTDAMSQLLALDQILNLQKDMQKQMNSVVSASVNKEVKQLEASLGQSIEKVFKASTDALWALFQEEKAKLEKLERDRIQQLTNLISNTINKDLPAVFEKTLEKEIIAVGPVVACAISPTVEKSVSSAIGKLFQKEVCEKVVGQLEKSVSSKLETTVARQIQAQFQTSGKQALKDAFQSNLESSIVPEFEMSCKAMFKQIDSTLQKGLLKHTTPIQQQLDTACSPLAIALRDAINSARSVTQSLSGELAEGLRKLLAIAAAGANTKTGNSLVTRSSNGPLVSLDEMVEATLDPTKELSTLIAEHKYEEAFTGALERSDLLIVSWLCYQVDLPGILSMVPLPLSQGVLLALLQQLACNINKETPRKLAWITDVAVAINPADPMIVMHARPVFEQVYQILGHHRNLPTTSASEANSIRILMHVINSLLMSCK